MANNGEIGKIENVQVVVRVRCHSIKEEIQNIPNITLANRSQNTISISNPKNLKVNDKIFTFDHILAENGTQMEVYQKVALPIVNKIFQGYNGTIFAYGQTGSGKTYTMTGIPTQNELKGVIPNTFSHIFNQIARASEEKSFIVTATYLEIYNEEVRDLLSPNPNEKLEIRERVDVGVYVKGLTGFIVDSIESINELTNLGNTNRITRATLMNKLSSRSHAIFTLTIEAKDRESKKTTIAKLNLVDLAGSERLKRTQATGEGLKEATNINQSLFVLSNVISALVEDKSNHIPYRNSKLTRLLQDSLGGNSKTAMIATISPCSTDYDETICTLRYASRAKLIKNHVKLNLQTDCGLIEYFENQIEELQSQLSNILMSVISTKPIKSKKDKQNSNEISKKHKMEILKIEDAKKELDLKISTLQNKILIGGKNLFDTAEEQQFMIETSIQEIETLDKSHQVLEEKLEEKEIERFDLEEQYSSLQDEDIDIDLKIKCIEKNIKKLQMVRDETIQENQQELEMLRYNKSSLNNQYKTIRQFLRHTIPKSNLKKIESRLVWNSETCDYHIVGLAHVGNNVRTSKRRFQRHIPISGLIETQLNRRKSILRVGSLLPRDGEWKLENVYQNYPPRKESGKTLCVSKLNLP